MLKLSRAGARIIPAMPAFYGRLDSVLDLVDFMVGKMLDQLGVENDLYKRWGTE
jgi:4-hydroxy-3-polyprenylbenzoate decarboxylase